MRLEEAMYKERVKKMAGKLEGQREKLQDWASNATWLMRMMGRLEVTSFKLEPFFVTGDGWAMADEAFAVADGLRFRAYDGTLYVDTTIGWVILHSARNDIDVDKIITTLAQRALNGELKYVTEKVMSAEHSA